jgi:branched-chain amino acid transport system permease protein
VTLIIITIGASILLRGLATLVWDKKLHTLPSFSGDTPIQVGGATMLPQSLWVMGITLVIVVLLGWFFGRTLIGKAVLATSHNPVAAQLCGINVRFVLFLSFGLSAGLGAVAGILIAPITLTSWDVGVMLGLKGFAAAILGGLGSGVGAVVGGLVLGIAESMGAGYLSSAYKDAIAFVIILAVLFFMPSGLFGKNNADRV